jgi:hypothetical protein
MLDPSLYVFVDNSNVLIEGRRFAEMKRSKKGRLSPHKDSTYLLLPPIRGKRRPP